MGKKQKKPQAFDVRVFERAADRVRDLSARIRAATDLIAEALEAAASHIRESRDDRDRLGRSVAEWREEHDCVCVHCKDTGVADSGWCEGETCHCPMGIARAAAEKVGLVSAAQRQARAEAAAQW